MNFSIADAFVAFHGDDAQLLTDAQRSGSKAGDIAGKTFGQRFGSTLKQAAGTAIGAGIGLAVGATLTGANALDAATRRLQADTGMTATEAARAEHALAGMFQNNLQGFDQIGAAMAAVHNDLGLVGDAADRATKRALRFSTATGQDAAEAVTRLDDIMDNWNINAERMGEIMDKLILSHQRWGGNLADNEVTLAKLAPAMSAANFQIDDGIALLGLFGAKGLDSERAAAAFSKALTKVKSPDELKALIKDIQNTTDPFKRAAKAADLFGAKAGAQLANALGGANLDDYAISASDAAGATDKAANAVQSGFGAQFTLLLHKAGGALADFGTQFGPLLIVANALGPSFLKILMSGIGALAAQILPKAVASGAATGVAMGTAAATAEVTAETTGVTAGQAGVAVAAAPAAAAGGTVIGTAMGVAAAAAIGIAIALAFKAIFLDPGLQKQIRDIGTGVANQIASGTTDQLAQSKAALEKGIADINALPLGGFLYGDQVSGLQGQLDAVNAEIARRAAEAGASVPTSLAAGAASTQAVWDGKVENIVTSFGTSMHGVWAAAHQAGSDGMLAMAQGITAARQKPLDAFDTLKEMLKKAMTPLSEVARLHGELTSKSLARGLRSGDPAVRAQALAVRDAIYERLGQLAAQGGKAGSAAMAELNKGIRSKVPAVHAAALAAKNAAVAELNKAKGGAAAAGAGAGQSFGDSLKAAIAAALASVQADIKANPGKYTDTMGGLSGGTHATGGIAPAYLPSLIGEKGPEVFVPKVDGRVLTTEQSMAALGGGNVTVNVQGLVRARDPMEIATQARRFARLGLFTPAPVFE